jgi:GH35 family endo-1,4-beta-xylanase
MQNIKSKSYLLFIFSGLLTLTGLTCAIAQTPIQTDVPALKEVFKSDFSIGCLLSYTYIGFPSDPYVPGQSGITAPTGGYLIKYHMNAMSPGNWMKSTYIVDMNSSASAYNSAGTQALKDSVDVNPKVTFNGNIIAQLNWAQRQGFRFRGHTLVWHNQHPGTAFFRTGYSATGARLSKEKMALRMENYIKEVFRIIHERWPGLLIAMDVVNEAINEDGSDRTTDSEWYLTFGDNSYVMKAFEYARKYTTLYGETQIKLYYNDYRTHVSSKANGIVRLCSPIFKVGLLDGIGMQEHDGLASPTAEQWITSYNKFDTICTEMSVTELDVKPDASLNQTTQANQYGLLFKCFLDRASRSGKGKLVNVSKDGLNDSLAFVKNASLWDWQNQCKPAFFEVVDLALNYHALDSLLAQTDTLHEAFYKPEKWAYFTTVLSDVQTAMSRNYDISTSAAQTMGDAYENLETALKSLTDIGSLANDIPSAKTFVLEQNYPNPFSAKTTIRFRLAETSDIQLVVYDRLGRTVARLAGGNYYSGTHQVVFDASDLPADIYFCTLKTADGLFTRKLTVLK